MNWRTVAIHLSLWILFIVSIGIIGTSFVGFVFFLENVPMFIIIAPIIFYTSYSFLIPRYYENKKYGQYFFWSSALIIISSIVRLYIEKEMITIPNGSKDLEGDHLILIRYLTVGLSVVGWALIFRIVADRRKKEKELYEWKALKNETDLKFLKNQLRPHFLFNSINNIYSIAIENQDKSAPLLLEISEMLRYLVSKADKDLIPIQEEIDFLNSLIKLYSLRFESVPFHEIVFEGSIQKHEIPPMIFLPFIENIFKHGDFEQLDKKWILNITMDENELVFQTRNPIRINDIDKEERSGIGLSNLRQRLDLLLPNAYSLETEQQQDSYACRLTLKLNG